MSQAAASATRRHDLDWLRVGAFLLLILYHIGMFYVPWGWHVKSAHAPVTALETPMRLMNTWRLPLLFFVSGVALRYACLKVPALGLVGRRLVLLGVPLLFGMLVICAPQSWHELGQGGHFDGGVGAFYRGYLSWPWASPEGWPMITPTWNHLWYLLYVLVYTLALLVLLAGAPRGVVRLGDVLEARALWLVPLVHLAIYAALHDSLGRAQTLWGDWFNLAASFWIMSAGFLLAQATGFWQRLLALRWISLGLAVALSILMVLAYGAWGTLFQGDHSRAVLRILHGWAVMWMLLGWGQVWLTKRHPVLTYLSAAVFTYYILHQTIIIMVGTPLTRLGWPLWAEMLTITGVTALGCWVGYHWVARKMGRFGILLGARNPRT